VSSELSRQTTLTAKAMNFVPWCQSGPQQFSWTTTFAADFRLYQDEIRTQAGQWCHHWGMGEVESLALWHILQLAHGGLHLAYYNQRLVHCVLHVACYGHIWLVYSTCSILKPTSDPLCSMWHIMTNIWLVILHVAYYNQYLVHYGSNKQQVVTKLRAKIHSYEDGWNSSK
jgi:hypothetical protein